MIHNNLQASHEVPVYDSAFFQRLFPAEQIGFMVETTDQRLLPYADLDHAATTGPFLAVKEYINEIFNSYGSVHRGAGQKSLTTTCLYDAARDRIRHHVGSSANNYGVPSTAICD